MEYLVFRLYGPMASWGEIAVGESRHTASYPSKSAILGLLAAALGIRRDEEERQQSLVAGYRFAVKTLSVGSLLRDYHTTQVPDSVGKFKYRTRRDELVCGKERLGTNLSSREYRCDALSLVAVMPLEGAPYSLIELKTALLKPKFHLYLGRKSCPLAAPLKPLIKSASGFRQAIDEYLSGPLYISRHLMFMAQKEIQDGQLAAAPSLAELSKDDHDALLMKKQQQRYYWEGDGGDIEAQQILTRHDQPLSRSRWQFAKRSEKLFIGKEAS